MSRRLVVASLWFAAFFCLHEIAWSLVGSPRAFGVVIGLIAAAWAYTDPTGVLGLGSTRSGAARSRS